MKFRAVFLLMFFSFFCCNQIESSKIKNEISNSKDNVREDSDYKSEYVKTDNDLISNYFEFKEHYQDNYITLFADLDGDKVKEKIQVYQKYKDENGRAELTITVYYDKKSFNIKEEIMTPINYIRIIPFNSYHSTAKREVIFFAIGDCNIDLLSLSWRSTFGENEIENNVQRKGVYELKKTGIQIDSCY